jgi:hypothetical protein
MRYTVHWTRIAQNQLAELWLDASDRAATARAADALDASLRVDAHQLGEARYGTMRIVFAPPLSCYIDVHEDDRKVYVLAVWAPRGRGR